MNTLPHKLCQLKNSSVLADYRLMRWLMLVAVAMSLAMSLLSPIAKQVHHDEHDHFSAARFYVDNWLPRRSEIRARSPRTRYTACRI